MLCKKMYSKALCIIALAVLLSAPSVSAETYVSGVIVGETWAIEGSPYYVEGDILVAGLTINPGVRVEFLEEVGGDGYEFEVAGVLTAVGTKTAPIVFARADTNEVGWQGMYFNYSSPGSELVYCTINGSINSGIRIEHCELEIKYTKIHGNTGFLGGGVKVVNTPIFSINHCSIFNNQGTTKGGGDLYF